MRKFLVKIHKQPYGFYVDAEDASQAEYRAMELYNGNSSYEDIKKVETIEIEREARTEYMGLLSDDADFAEQYGNNEKDFKEWFEDVYLPSLD